MCIVAVNGSGLNQEMALSVARSGGVLLKDVEDAIRDFGVPLPELHGLGDLGGKQLGWTKRLILVKHPIFNAPTHAK